MEREEYIKDRLSDLLQGNICTYTELLACLRLDAWQKYQKTGWECYREAYDNLVKVDEEFLPYNENTCLIKDAAQELAERVVCS